MKITLKKKLAAAAAAATIAGGAGVAFAYWTSSGTGTGSATAGDSSAWAVTTDAATGGPLTPGGPEQTVGIHVKNNSSGHQGLQSLTVKVANLDGTPWTLGGACDADDFTIGTAAAGAEHVITLPPVDLAPGATHDDSVAVKMINKNVSQDACKNVTVPLHVTAA